MNNNCDDTYEMSWRVYPLIHPYSQLTPITNLSTGLTGSSSCFPTTLVCHTQEIWADTLVTMCANSGELKFNLKKKAFLN